MSNIVDDLLRTFITDYIAEGHTVSEESLNWIDEQIDNFLNNWDYELSFWFVVPLWSCIASIREAGDPNDYSYLYTLHFDEYRLRDKLKRTKELSVLGDVVISPRKSTL